MDPTGESDDIGEHGFAVDPVEEVTGDEFRCFWISGVSRDPFGTERDTVE